MFDRSGNIFPTPSPEKTRLSNLPQTCGLGLQIQSMKTNGDITNRVSFLREPSAYSAELTNIFGVGTRTARSAVCRHGEVSSGDVLCLALQEGGEEVRLLARCKAPLHKEGEENVQLFVERMARVRSATAKSVYCTFPDYVNFYAIDVFNFCVF